MQSVSNRRAGILRLVVREYVDTAAPVASKAIWEKYELPASPATIRSEMQALEAAGLLTHPHTSAGRVPSDEGYRYFVESLMGPEELRDDEKATIRHQFYQAAPELDEWAQLGAVLLARSLGLLAVVALPRSEEVRIRHLELVSLKDLLALLVVVLREARVLKQLVTLDAVGDQAELSQISARLNDQVAGKTLSEIRQRPPTLEGSGTAVAEALVQLLEDHALREGGAHVQGLGDFLEQPEFQDDHEEFANLIGLLDQPSFDRVVPLGALADGGVSVVIGEENPAQEMRRCSVVVAPYSAGSRHSGFVGVVGPTRMRYGRAVASARYLSSLLDELMYDVYG